MIKIYIQYSEFRAHSVFQGKCMLLKVPESKSIRNIVKIFRANSVLQDNRKLLKYPEQQKIYSIQWKISVQILFFRER